jgi:hypothetical protein
MAEKHRNFYTNNRLIRTLFNKVNFNFFYSIKSFPLILLHTGATKQAHDATTSHELMSIEHGGHTTWLDEEQLASCNSDTQAFH